MHVLQASNPSDRPPYGPFGSLPAELLSEIFLLCMDERMDESNTIQTPLLLSKICIRWRAAAIDNPQLWSRLSIQLTGATSKPKSELVDTWLKRSGAFPLSIYVCWEEPPFADTHIILEKIMQHSERWQTMFFYLPYRAFKSFTRVRKRLPMLTDLSLGTDDDTFPWSTPPWSVIPSNLDVFEIAPRLRSLEFVNFSSTALKFPWTQLQDIPLISGNINDCLDVLHRSTRLSKISMMVVEGALIPWTGPPSPALLDKYQYVSHTYLTTLMIMTHPWNEFVDLSDLFPHLTLPRLETLTICNLNSTFGEEFTQFLSRLPTLKTLHLRNTALPDDELVEGLKHLGSLTNLIVLSSPSSAVSSPTTTTMQRQGEQLDLTVTRYLLEALTRNIFSNDDMDGMLLPRLKKLELAISHAAARELDTFIDMLHSRLRVDESDSTLAKLEQVRVRPCGYLDNEFFIRLIEMRDYGLDVQVENMCLKV